MRMNEPNQDLEFRDNLGHFQFFFENLYFDPNVNCSVKNKLAFFWNLFILYFIFNRQFCATNLSVENQVFKNWLSQWVQWLHLICCFPSLLAGVTFLIYFQPQIPKPLFWDKTILKLLFSLVISSFKVLKFLNPRISRAVCS